MRYAVAVAFLAFAAPLAAWGPFAHQVVDAEAFRVATARPALAFLGNAECTSAFVAAAAMPDATFSFTAGGKTDEALDDLLHRAEFHQHLVAEARRSGHAPELAYALGWAGHVVADDVGNGPDTVTRRDLFGLPGDLTYLQTGMVKLLVDGVLSAHPRASRATPRLNVGLLSRALASYTGPLAQGGQSAGAWTTRLQALDRSFGESFDLWMQVAYLVGRNDQLCRDLTGLPLGPDPTWGVSGIQSTVDAVVALLEASVAPTSTSGAGGGPAAELLTGTPAASSSGIIPLLGVSNTPSGPAAVSTVERVDRAIDIATALLPMPLVGAPRLGVFGWMKQKAVQATATVSLWALEHAPATLLDARKRTFAAFCLALAQQSGGFNELKARVRRQVGR